MTHSGGAPMADQMPEGGDAPAWVMLPPDSIPARWRSRAQHVALIALLSEEAANLLAGTPAVPALDDRDERLASMVVAGASMSQMARAVGLSRRGVGHRLARLRQRFGVATTAELIAELGRLGFRVAQSGNAPPQGQDAAPANTSNTQT